MNSSSEKLLRRTNLDMPQSDKAAWSQFNVGRRLFALPALADYDNYLSQLLSGLIAKSEVVAEYGCGDGIWLEYLGKLFPKKRFIGVEWNRRLVWYARQQRLKKLKNVTVFQKDATKISVECDFFFAFGVIEHFENSTLVLKSWVKTLSPNVFVVITVPNLLNWKRVTTRHGLKLEDIKDKDSVATKAYGFEWLMSPNTFLKTLIDAGLEVVLFRWLEELPSERSLLAIAGKRARK